MNEAFLVIGFITIALVAMLLRNRYTISNSAKETENGVSIYGFLPAFRIDLKPESIKRILVYEISMKSLMSRRYKAYNCLNAYNIREGGKVALIMNTDNRPVATNWAHVKSLAENLPSGILLDETKT